MKQFVIFGIGRFGASIATTLYNMGHDVLAVDKNEERVQYISDKVTHAIQADATDENTLKAIGIRNFDAAVVAIGEDIQASILITLLCKEAGVSYVLAKARNELHSKVLYKIGADKVVFPERDMGIRVAQSLVSTNILDYIQLTPHYSLVELEAVPAWENRTLKELDIRAKYGINVMAIKRGEHINISPAGTDTIQEGDVLVVLGEADEIERFQEKSNEKSNRK
ncbi:MAG TPA: TrkA family potassium uptake protein [Clostridiales bacterium]|nr:TrkA family potassium uptake protein [Clostridiales bacterium]